MRTLTICTYALVAAISTSLATCQAGTITFSGYDWTTEDTGASYTTPTTESSEVTGGVGNDAGMSNALDLEVGDVVTFDLMIANGTQGGSWDVSVYFKSDNNIGTCCGGTAASDRVLYRDPAAGLYIQQYSNNVPSDSSFATTPFDGVQFSYEITSATTADFTVSNQTSPGVYTPAFSSTVYLYDVSEIDTIRIGSWDSDQTVSIANFTVTSVPEPTSGVVLVALLSFAGIIRGSRMMQA